MLNGILILGGFAVSAMLLVLWVHRRRMKTPDYSWPPLFGRLRAASPGGREPGTGEEGP